MQSVRSMPNQTIEGGIECKKKEGMDMARKAQKIRTESYVYGKDGSLIRFDDLSYDQKVRAATELKLRYLRAMFPGVEFYAVGKKEQEATG